MKMKIKIYKKENELIGKIVEVGDKEIDFTNLTMIDALYKCNEEVKLEFDGLSDIEKSKIENLFKKIEQRVTESKTSNLEESKLE